LDFSYLSREIEFSRRQKTSLFLGQNLIFVDYTHPNIGVSSIVMVSLSVPSFVAFSALCLAAITEAGESLAPSTLAPTTDSLASNSTSTNAPPPPPLPTGNDVCAFENLDTLVNRAVHDWAGYNMSLLVEACPKAGEVAFGTGNPDISGPGVSYLLVAGICDSNDRYARP
jgi:hypothetical protein